MEVINSALAETVLSSIQKVLGVQLSGLNSARDHWSGRLDRSPEDRFSSMDFRSGRLDCNPSGRSGRTDHRSKRPGRSPHARLDQLDQRGHGIVNSKLSSQGGLIKETSLDF